MKFKLEAKTKHNNEPIDVNFEMEISVKEMMKYAEGIPYIIQQLKELNGLYEPQGGKSEIDKVLDLEEELNEAYSRIKYWEERSEKKDNEIYSLEGLLEEAEASVDNLQKVIKSKNKLVEDLIEDRDRLKDELRDIKK